MKRSKMFILSLVIMSLALVVGCSKKPETVISDTKAAADAVVAEGGEKYAAEELKMLNDEMTAAMDEVKVQDEKFLKNYDKAAEMLTSVKTKAETLKAEIPARKEKAKNDAIAELDAAKAAVTEASDLLAKAPKGKGTMADIQALGADITGINESLAEVQSMIDGENYMEAAVRAGVARESAAAVSAQITEALAKTGKK